MKRQKKTEKLFSEEGTRLAWKKQIMLLQEIGKKRKWGTRANSGKKKGERGL